MCRQQNKSTNMKKLVISYVIPAPGSAVIWLVTNTATLYSKMIVHTWDEL